MRAVLVLAAALAVAGSGLPGKAEGARRYVVAPGDSLTLIAQRYGISLGRLTRANRLDPAATLEIGTVLRLPVPPRRQAAGVGRWSEVYVVRPGDTLSEIAVQYGVSLAALAEANGIDAGGVLPAGAKLKVPQRAGEPRASRLPALTITVRAGDTLSGLALRYGISLASLSSFNHIDVSAPILIGQRLAIPATSAASMSLETLARSEVSPYPRLSSGVDISYPDCARETLTAGAFAIVGLNNGRPFTANPCFAEEYAAATAAQMRPSIYLNSAYAPSLQRHITADCLQTATEREAGRALQLAYAVGCSEAETAEGQLGDLEAAAIWIDIEPANTWSRRIALNRATITGLVDTLLRMPTRPVVGIYSAPAYWRDLVGDWSAFELPQWIATGPSTGCTTPFATGPVWLSQHATTRDLDASC